MDKKTIDDQVNELIRDIEKWLEEPIGDKTQKEISQIVNKKKIKIGKFAVSPFDARTYYHRGNAYYEKGSYEKAIANYIVSLKLNPNFSESYFNRGLSYYNLQEFDKSIEDYTKAAELDPRNAVIYNNRGDAYYRKQEFETAIEDYDKAIRLNPRYLKAFYNRGLAFACLQDYKTAIKDFDEVIKLNPGFSEAYHIRGLAYDYLSGSEDTEINLRKAIAGYEQALNLNPSFAEAVSHMHLSLDRLIPFIKCEDELFNLLKEVLSKSSLAKFQSENCVWLCEKLGQLKLSDKHRRFFETKILSEFQSIEKNLERSGKTDLLYDLYSSFGLKLLSRSKNERLDFLKKAEDYYKRKKSTLESVLLESTKRDITRAGGPGSGNAEVNIPVDLENLSNLESVFDVDVRNDPLYSYKQKIYNVYEKLISIYKAMNLLIEGKAKVDFIDSLVEEFDSSKERPLNYKIFILELLWHNSQFYKRIKR